MDLLIVACRVPVGAVLADAAFARPRSRADLRPFAPKVDAYPTVVTIDAGDTVVSGGHTMPHTLPHTLPAEVKAS
ncbi:hypothetical protein [Nonomuraea sp. KM90]|uniref:hypothetical protein n=1 Tax=Nonomuraea sp. KM90 TaxID=3457428 RepID=UPI003FCD354B